MGKYSKVKLLVFNGSHYVGLNAGLDNVIIVFMYNNEFSSKFFIKKSNNIFHAHHLYSLNRNTLYKQLKKQAIVDKKHPIIGGNLITVPSIQTILSKRLKKIPSPLETAILGTTIMEKAKYYGDINKIIKIYNDTNETKKT